MIEMICSGGQTGVDRAALDIAINLNIPHCGWCPKGRKAEDAPLHNKYKLMETESEDYSERTKLNIRDSDGTLIFVPSLPLKVTDGTQLTIQEVIRTKKPFLIIDLSKETNLTRKLGEWVHESHITKLNIAGPRESQSPGIYNRVYSLLDVAIKELKEEIERKPSCKL